ncbi:hypothetical protein GE09DRAFT_1219399 [Coniochaeta sp. 2T2.1]|nr:hypothetical protein GE09DRAFT_1219399 [Coniochaeta sp. 2T2.1]
MSGSLITGPEPLQSWWLPDEESRKNGWGQRYEDEQRQVNPHKKKEKKTGSKGHKEASEKLGQDKNDQRNSQATSPKT